MTIVMAVARVFVLHQNTITAIVTRQRVRTAKSITVDRDPMRTRDSQSISESRIHYLIIVIYMHNISQIIQKVSLPKYDVIRAFKYTFVEKVYFLELLGKSSGLIMQI